MLRRYAGLLALAAMFAAAPPTVLAVIAPDNTAIATGPADTDNIIATTAPTSTRLAPCIIEDIHILSKTDSSLVINATDRENSMCDLTASRKGGAALRAATIASASNLTAIYTVNSSTRAHAPPSLRTIETATGDMCINGADPSINIAIAGFR